MKFKDFFCMLGCAGGGVLIGVFAGKLDSGMGAFLFCAGIILLIFSALTMSGVFKEK
ncbi:MAG: hypothetical protein IJP23_02940 [Oscillospiraceae bacterium]|nr:hypothetical protein [Oscillospiraceae bacterium]